MKVSQIAKITKAKVFNLQDEETRQFSIDTRILQERDFFVPLEGSNVDGHEFISDALKKGASGSFSKKNISGKNILIVEDPLKALTDVAVFNREKVKLRIGITGTAGKTTTKELIAFALSSEREAYYTKGNLNNHIGLPLTLANIRKTYDWGVFELGASQREDIKHLSSILNQEIGIITNVGKGHIGGYTSFNELLEEKLSILESARVGIVREDLKRYIENKKVLSFGYSPSNDVQILESKIISNGTYGKIKVDNKTFDLFFPFFNKKIIESVSIVFLLFKLLGLNLKDLPLLLRDFTPVNGRGNLIKIGNLTVVDDTYNANPESVKNAIETLNQISGKKIFILGDMLELGNEEEKEHEKVGRLLLSSNIDTVYLYGNAVKNTYKVLKGKKEVHLLDKSEISEKLKKVKEPTTVWIKGSRGMRMEDVIKELF